MDSLEVRGQKLRGKLNQMPHGSTYTYQAGDKHELLVACELEGVGVEEAERILQLKPAKFNGVNVICAEDRV